MRQFFALALGLALSACSATAAAPQKAFTITGFSQPESVLYDAKADSFFVSNVNGEPVIKDNNGFISRVAPDGTITQLRWIAGGVNGVTLHAPKGMAQVGDTLYVTDIDTVRLFDATSGAPKGSVDVPGATFLNDLASAPDGSVYVDDSGLTNDFKPTGTDAVYRITPQLQLQRVSMGESLAGPNGLTVLPDGRVQVVSFKSNSTYQLDVSGTQVGKLALPKGQLDGVAQWNGGLLITSWEASTLYFLGAGGSSRVVADKLTAPADLGVDTKRARAFVPQLSQNVVRVIPLPR